MKTEVVEKKAEKLAMKKMTESYAENITTQSLYHILRRAAFHLLKET